MDILENLKKEIAEEMSEKENDRGILDIISHKLVSKKLLVWGIATALLLAGKIDADQWNGLSLAYVGAEGFADFATRWKVAGK